MRREAVAVGIPGPTLFRTAAPCHGGGQSQGDNLPCSVAKLGIEAGIRCCDTTCSYVVVRCPLRAALSARSRDEDRRAELGRTGGSERAISKALARPSNLGARQSRQGKSEQASAKAAVQRPTPAPPTEAGRYARTRRVRAGRGSGHGQDTAMNAPFSSKPDMAR